MELGRRKAIGAGLIIVGVGIVAFFLAAYDRNMDDTERLHFALGIAIGAMLVVGGWFLR
jgi:hypothetical protein